MEPVFKSPLSQSITNPVREQPQTPDLKGLGLLKKETIHRSNNFFSSKGLVVNAYRAPFQLLKSAYIGIKVAYKEGMVKGISKFFNKMSESWDIYQPLKKLSPGDDRSEKIVKENIRYAGLMNRINTNNEDISRIVDEKETILKDNKIIEELVKDGRFGFLDNFDDVGDDDIIQFKKSSDSDSETSADESAIEQPSEKPSSSKMIELSLNPETSPKETIEPSSEISITEKPKTPKKQEEENIIGKFVSAKSFQIHNSYLTQLEEIAKIPETETSELEDKKALEEMVGKLIDMGFKQKEGYFYDVNTGNIFTIACDKNELVLCFEGMDAHVGLLKDDPDASNAMSIAQSSQMKKEYMGNVPASAQQAIDLGKLLKEVAKDHGATPVVVGHSHGGGLAQAAAAAADIKGVVFNSRPIGRGVRKYIQEKYIEEGKKETNPKSSNELRKEFIKSTDDNITAFAGKGDFVTKGVRALTLVVNGMLGISVPRNLGTGYYIDVKYTPPNPENTEI